MRRIVLDRTSEPPDVHRVGGSRGLVDHNVRVRITFATAELAPLVSVGGLAAAAGGLVQALRRAILLQILAACPLPLSPQ